MIFSFKHKFIFFRPRKTGSTSVGLGLTEHCGKNDIILKINNYNPDNDEDKYENIIQEIGCMNIDSKKVMFGLSLPCHATPSDLQKYMHWILSNQPEHDIFFEEWKEYFKFSITRNPWDRMVSRFWWHYADRSEKNYLQKFDHFILNYDFCEAKEDHCFDMEGKSLDFIIRYENLEQDYQFVCKKIGIPYKKLPRTKNKLRLIENHYRDYYGEDTREIVYKNFIREIEFFGYKF